MRLQWEHVERGTTRGLRFPLVMPIRYRASHDIEWQEGTSLNISGSGLLFRAERPLEPLTPVAIRFTLPRVAAGAGVVRIACQGCVVRSVTPPGEHPLVAATIAAYRFVGAGEHDDWASVRD